MTEMQQWHHALKDTEQLRAQGIKSLPHVQVSAKGHECTVSLTRVSGSGFPTEGNALLSLGKFIQLTAIYNYTFGL